MLIKVIEKQAWKEEEFAMSWCTMLITITLSAVVATSEWYFEGARRVGEIIPARFSFSKIS